MAPPNTLPGSQLFIKVGDGLSPEVFAHPCLINTDRGLQFTSQAGDVIVPDCANPDDPAWLEHVKDALSAVVNGAGTLNLDDVADFDAWFRSKDPKNIQVWLGTHGHWGFSAHLTEFQITGTRQQKAQCTLNIVSEGIVPAYIPAV